MKAIHLICKRDDGVTLNNLSHDRTSGLSRSGHWDLSAQEAGELVGGWIYLHPTKATASEFGGVVDRVEEVTRPDLPRSERIVFVVRRSPLGKGQRWRGASHGMAHNGGLVEADLPHEQAPT